MDNFLTQLSSISIIDWFAMLTGIVGVYLSIKEKILAWPLFILCYATYVYISLRGNYYAFGGMNVIFVLVFGSKFIGQCLGGLSHQRSAVARYTSPT